MSDVQRCDECRRYSDAAPRSRWLRIAPLSGDPLVCDGIGRPLAPVGDFCSAECLAAHALRYAAQYPKVTG